MTAYERLSTVINQLAKLNVLNFYKQLDIYAVITPKFKIGRFTAYNFTKQLLGTPEDTIKWSSQGDYWLPISEFLETRILVRIPYKELKRTGKVQ